MMIVGFDCSGEVISQYKTYCKKDKKKRDPWKIDECPIGCDKCDVTCPWYHDGLDRFYFS